MCDLKLPNYYIKFLIVEGESNEKKFTFMLKSDGEGFNESSYRQV